MSLSLESAIEEDLLGAKKNKSVLVSCLYQQNVCIIHGKQLLYLLYLSPFMVHKYDKGQTETFPKQNVGFLCLEPAFI